MGALLLARCEFLPYSGQVLVVMGSVVLLSWKRATIKGSVLCVQARGIQYNLSLMCSGLVVELR